MKIQIYYTAFLENNWRLICQSQISKICDSGLYDECYEFRVYLTGTEYNREQFKMQYAHLKKVIYLKDDARNLFEWPALLDLIKTYSDFNLYFHTKGVTRSCANTEDWRNFMDYFNLIRWRLCIEKMNDGYEMVGVNLSPIPKLHYSGNYFWAAGIYISKFNNQLVHDINNRLDCEFIVTSLQPFALSLHNSNINHYNEPYPSEKYEF